MHDEADIWYRRLQYRQEAVTLIIHERERQENLKAEGRFKHTPFDTGMQEPEKLASILEECGEVARNTLSRSYLVTDGERDDQALLRELTQVAALSCAWMERLIANKDQAANDIDALDDATGGSRR
jgi:hypothetical protein